MLFYYLKTQNKNSLIKPFYKFWLSIKYKLKPIFYKDIKPWTGSIWYKTMPRMVFENKVAAL